MLNKRDNITAGLFALCLVPTKDGRSLVKFPLALALAASGVIVSVPLFAHHGNASYDSTKTVTVKGTVTDYIWANPNLILEVAGKGNSGNTVHWTIETQ